MGNIRLSFFISFAVYEQYTYIDTDQKIFITVCAVVPVTQYVFMATRFVNHKMVIFNRFDITQPIAKKLVTPATPKPIRGSMRSYRSHSWAWDGAPAINDLVSQIYFNEY